jgi:hypothetical protein
MDRYVTVCCLWIVAIEALLSDWIECDWHFDCNVPHRRHGADEIACVEASVQAANDVKTPTQPAFSDRDGY